MKKALILLAFWTGISWMGVPNAAQRAPTWHTFYKGGYDYDILDQEGYLKKISDPLKIQVTQEEILASAERNFGRKFADFDDYKKFVRSPEVTVGACTFKNALVEHLELNPRRIGAQARDPRYDGETCLKYQGGDRISLPCGQGIADPRRVFPKPTPIPPPPPPPPPAPKPVDEKKVAITFEECNPVMSSSSRSSRIYIEGPTFGMLIDNGFVQQNLGYCTPKN